MTDAIVKAVSESGQVYFYTGKGGEGWLSKVEAEALPYCFEGAQRKAEVLRRGIWGATIRFYAMHVPHNYQTCILRGSSNWDCYLTSTGRLQAVPNEQGRQRGCAESYYGDREHLRRLMADGYFVDYDGFTEAGLEYMAGLCCSLTWPRAGVRFHTESLAA